MIDLKIDDALLSLSNISRNDLPTILNLYNKIDDFKFATGIDKPMTLDKLYQKYLEVLVCNDEFYLGIYLKADNSFIGVLKGGVNANSKNSLWINSIIIDSHYQDKGYGTRSVTLITEYFKNNYKVSKTCISVVGANTRAIEFWDRLGFAELRKMDNHIVLDNIKRDVIIMEKELNI